MDKKEKYEDITITVGTCEGFPIKQTITAKEQEEFVAGGYGTVSDLIEINKNSYRDWQADC